MKVLSHFVEGLIAEFDGSEADSTITLRFARVKLPERKHCLAIALLIEGNCHSESIGVVVFVRPVIENQPFVGYHLQKHHSTVVSVTIGRNHVESPHCAGL